MMAFQTTSPSNAVVTAFMRWPALTTFAAAALTLGSFMPQEVDNLVMMACEKVVANDVCERLRTSTKAAEPAAERSSDQTK